MRHGRSEQAGDLKAGNITLLLDWMTTSGRLTLPRATRGLGLARYVLEFLNLLSSTHKLEMGFAGGAGLLDSIEVDLQLFELDAGVGELVVKVTIVMDLAGESPVVVDEESAME